MKQMWAYVWSNPKSTAAGFLAFVATTCAALTPFAHAPKTCLVLAIASGLARAYIGIIMKDAK